MSTGSCIAIQLPLYLASEGDDKSNRFDRRLVELLCRFVTDEGDLAALSLSVVLDYNNRMSELANLSDKSGLVYQL